MSRFLARGWTAAFLAVAALPAVAVPAFAHVTLEPAEAQSGRSFKGTLKVPHGCEGAATTAIQVTLPDGVISVKPQPKAGWTLATQIGDYGRSYEVMHGPPVSKGVKTITWSGGELPDAYYDEFTFVAYLAPQANPATLYFPVLQSCGTTSTDWAEIPAAGAPRPPRPAPVLKVAAAAQAQTAAMFKAGDITIETPWSRATPGGAKVAGGFLKITNAGTTPDTLVSGTFAASGRVEIHEMAVKDGVMTMRPLKDGLVIPPGGSVTLAPGGYHLMFMDLAQQLKDGDTVKGTLVFEKAGKVDVTFQVRSIGAGAGAPPASGGMSGMDHKH